MRNYRRISSELLFLDSGNGALLSTGTAAGAGIGFGVALLLFSGIRERIDVADVPKMFKGVPCALIAAGIVAASFMGFGGIVENLFG